MKPTDLLDPDYRPTFSGHETFSLRYGWLQKAYEAASENVSDPDASHVFRDPASISRFGVGKNMVGSIRYWAKATGIIEDDGKTLKTAWLGELLFGDDAADPYLEEEASLWLLHWNLASRTDHTSWYWLFNEYVGGVFTRKQITNTLLDLSETAGWQRVAEMTVDRDLQCLLRTYVGGRGGEEVGDSILAELGLIRPLGEGREGRYAIARGNHPGLTDEVFLYALCDYWQRHAAKQSTLSFEAVAFNGGSPGRAFALDESGLMDRLEGLEAISEGAFAWSETAGLRQVVRTSELSDQQLREKLARHLRGTGRKVAA